MYIKTGKRITDILLSFAMIVLTLPLMLALAALLLLANQGSPFFVQTRPGRQGKAFRLVKFKTMTDRRDADGNLLSDDRRLTTLGSIVRKLSLDELPQLWNVLVGEMSLVGPRPLLVEYLPLYNARQARRHELRPGITGWAQINGRNRISWNEKFELDIWYVDHVSFALDIRILWMTVLNVLRRKDINSAAQLPMPKFTGNRTPGSTFP